MVMDTGFPCQVCPKSFASKSSLRHHTYTHNETEEVCNECGEVFSTKKNCTITRESTGKEKRPKWSSVITALMSQQALMSNDIWKLPIICPVMNVESQLKVQRVSRITKGWSIMQNLVLFADWVLQEVTTWRGTWGHIRISKILRMPQKFRRWKGKRSFVVKLVGSRQREKVIWRDIWGKLTWSG